MSIVLSLRGLCNIFISEGTSSFVQMEGAMDSSRKKLVLPDATESIVLSGPENSSRFITLGEPFFPSNFSSYGMGRFDPT